MKVALIGVTGRVGSRLMAELLARGHQVKGVARKAPAAAAPAVAFEIADANDPAALSPVLAGHDAVISATRFESTDAKALIAGVKQSGVKRLLVVGGASSLEVAPGKALIDSPGFPDAYKPEASAGRVFLEALRAEPALDWTYLSPSAEFNPGIRTGSFRLGTDQLLTDANGKSWISMEDFAIALVDELDHPRHSRRRFTVGY